MRISFSRFWRVLLTGVLCLSLLLTTTPLRPVTAADETGEGAVSVTFTNPITTSGGITMTASGKGDSAYTFTTVQERPAITVDKYAYFQISNTAVCAAREVTVTVTFLDGNDNVVIQYCGENGAYTYAHIYTTKSGQLRTVSVPLYDAALGNAAQNHRASFRLCSGTVLAITVEAGVSEETTVTFTDPIATSAAIDVIPSNPQNSDSAYTLTTVQGQPAAVLDEYMYFRVNDATLKYAKYLTITLTYFDEGNAPILLQYCSTTADYELLHVHRFNTGEFVTVEIPLQNAAFSKAAQNFGAAFRFYGGTLQSLSIAVGCADNTDQAPPAFAPQTEQNNIIGKGIAGYQVWFRASEKQTGGHWHHWAQDGEFPTAGNVHPEIYPFTDDYVKNNAVLYQTGLANLGNGNPSVLFNSSDREVIKTHMQWAEEYDIDGLAVQRFYSATYPMRSNGRNTLQVIQEEAEAHGRLFYVMYDFSFASRNNPETFIRNVQHDFIYNVEEKGVASSPNYGHADGKPVVCLWGLHGDPASEYFCGETATTLIDWFQSRGYYVIGGSPDNGYNRATGEYLEPFTKIDMLSLWTPGRYNMNNMENWLKQHVEIDLAFCEQYGIDYQPVLYSGFGWTNMGNNGYVNHYPRYAGDFLWKQAYILKRDYNVESVYFAMWDEYDEGTAIMKGATDYFEIPTDQYFLTWATDGWWLSNDFYLRAAGAVIDMMQGKTPVREKIDIPHSEGPIYWRNSFESRETTYTDDNGATTKTIVSPLDVCLNNPAWLNRTAFSTRSVTVNVGTAKSGNYAFRFNGTASDDAKAVYKIADTRITASAPLELSYSLYAANESGRDVYVDLLFADGTRLSDVNVAVATRGTVGEWVDVTLSLGQAASTQSIVGVAVGYRGESGTVDAYIDDIVLQHADLSCTHKESESRPQTDATCTESGVTAGVWCLACGMYIEGGEPIPPHATEQRDRIEPAVGQVGYTAGTWCTVCEKYIEGGEEIPALILWGDVNSNGTVNSTDARLTLQYAVGKVTPIAIDLTAADVDQSGTVDSTDARLILQYTVRKIEHLPIGGFL